MRSVLRSPFSRRWFVIAVEAMPRRALAVGVGVGQPAPVVAMCH
jgi:hypothetical protein